MPTIYDLAFEAAGLAERQNNHADSLELAGNINRLRNLAAVSRPANVIYESMIDLAVACGFAEHQIFDASPAILNLTDELIKLTPLHQLKNDTARKRWVALSQGGNTMRIM